MFQKVSGNLKNLNFSKGYANFRLSLTLRMYLCDKLNNRFLHFLFTAYCRPRETYTWVMFADREAETGADCPSAWRSQVYSFHALLCTLGWTDFWDWCWLSLCLAQSGLQYSFHSLLCALGWSDFWERESKLSTRQAVQNCSRTPISKFNIFNVAL